MIDLHTHSIFSDGLLSPSQLVAMANELGLKALALTDHDTIGGISEALTALKTAFSHSTLIFIPGIEIEVHSLKGEMHFLGLNIDYENAELEYHISSLQLKREQRNRKILEKLGSDGITIEYDDLSTLKGKSGHDQVIGRPHIAAVLVDKGYALNFHDAFRRFIGSRAPYFEPIAKPSPEETIQVIQNAGGKVILAHPPSLNLNWSEMEEQIVKLKYAGLDGIEVYHPGTRPGAGIRLKHMARKYGLQITGGSDFHGFQHSPNKPGHHFQGRQIKDRWLPAF